MEYEYKSIDPKELKVGTLHAHLLAAVAPRPIAFVSTTDLEGNVNLSPFSFFNVFGANPPLLIFSPARRVRDNTTKHTLDNAAATMEVVVQMVNLPMAAQASLASCEYALGVNEFEKAGLTMLPSLLVKPPRVMGAPAAFECKVLQIIETGQEGGSGNLVVCEILYIHLRADLLDENGFLDTQKSELVARMGGDFYCVASGSALFKMPKPTGQAGMGFDSLPDYLLYNPYLSQADLAALAHLPAVPNTKQFELWLSGQTRNWLHLDQILGPNEWKPFFYGQAKVLIRENDIFAAWAMILIANRYD